MILNGWQKFSNPALKRDYNFKCVFKVKYSVPENLDCKQPLEYKALLLHRIV